MGPLKIVSFYTVGTPYEVEAASLRESCLRTGSDFHIEPIESLGRWDRNCCQKPRFLLEQLRRWNRPLLWVDADAIVLQKPSLSLACDLAVLIDPRRAWRDCSKVNTATLYVTPGERTTTLLEEWHLLCDLFLEHPSIRETWDQVALQQLLPREGVVSLPIGYCAIFDSKVDLALPQEEIFILQTQASRSYKKIINGEMVSLLDSLTIEERRLLRKRGQSRTPPFDTFSRKTI